MCFVRCLGNILRVCLLYMAFMAYNKYTIIMLIYSKYLGDCSSAVE